MENTPTMMPNVASLMFRSVLNCKWAKLMLTRSSQFSTKHSARNGMMRQASLRYRAGSSVSGVTLASLGCTAVVAVMDDAPQETEKPPQKTRRRAEEGLPAHVDLCEVVRAFGAVWRVPAVGRVVDGREVVALGFGVQLLRATVEDV